MNSEESATTVNRDLIWYAILPPDQPNKFRSEQGDRWAILAWEPPVATKSKPVQEYVLKFAPVDITYVFNADKRSLVMALPTEHERITVSLTARNLAGDSEPQFATLYINQTNTTAGISAPKLARYGLLEDLLLLQNEQLTTLFEDESKADIALVLAHSSAQEQKRLLERVLLPEQGWRAGKNATKVSPTVQEGVSLEVAGEHVPRQVKQLNISAEQKARVQRNSIWRQPLVWFIAIGCMLALYTGILINASQPEPTASTDQEPDINATVESLVSQRMESIETQVAVGIEVSTSDSAQPSAVNPALMLPPTVEPAKPLPMDTATATLLPTATATVTPESSTPTPPATVEQPTVAAPDLPLVSLAILAQPNVDLLNVRSGPGEQYPIIGTLSEEDRIMLLGRNADSTWMQMALEGNQGWIAGWLVNIEGDLNSLPVITPPPLPTPIPSPVAIAPTAILVPVRV